MTQPVDGGEAQDVRPSFTIGSWPPPRATVALHFRDYDYFHGVELTAEDARSLAFMLLDRALSADGVAEWWKHDARREHVQAAVRADLLHEVSALKRPVRQWVQDSIGKRVMAHDEGWNAAIDAVLAALGLVEAGERP